MRRPPVLVSDGHADGECAWPWLLAIMQNPAMAALFPCVTSALRVALRSRTDLDSSAAVSKPAFQNYPIPHPADCRGAQSLI